MADIPNQVNPVSDPYLPLDHECWGQLYATPEDFMHESFASHDVEDGVRMITGTIKATGEAATVAYCFAGPAFDAPKAKEWLDKKEIKYAKLDPARNTTYRQITAKGICFADCPVQLTAEADGTQKRLPKLDILVYAGGPVQPAGWDFPIVVDLQGLEIPDEQTTVLKDHDPDKVVGHGTTINSGRDVRLRGVVSAVGEAAREVLGASANGFQWKSSIGCDRQGDPKFIREGETLNANGQTFSGPLYFWPSSILREVTITGRGADPNSRVSIAAKAAKPQGVHKMDELFAAYVKELGLEPLSLTETQKTKLQAAYTATTSIANAESELEATIKAAKRKMGAEIASEMARLDRLKASYTAVVSAWSLDRPEHDTKRKLAEELRAKATDNDGNAWSADKIELEFLRLGRPDGVISNTRANTGDFDARVLEAAACRNLMMDEKKMEKYFKPEVLEASTRPEFRNFGLKALLCSAASSKGWGGRWINSDDDIRDVLHYAYPDRRTLRAESSTFQLPGILSNLANKYLNEGFWMVDDAWSKIASKRPAPDFKPVPGFRMYGNLTFEKIGKNGEIPHGDVGELVYVNAAETYAKGIVTTRQDIRNDDLSALSRIPQLIGMGAAYALNHVFWTVFLAGKDSQGKTVFSATHTDAGNKGNSNLQTGSTTANGITQTTSALSTTSLSAVRQLFREQIKPDGEPLGFPPYALLVPPALETQAEQIYKSVEMRQVVQGAGNASGAAYANVLEAPVTNVFKGQFEPIVTPYIGATDYPSGATAGSDASWYLIANPSQLALIEIVFLDGQQTPTVQSSEADFDVLGIAHRGFFDFGVKTLEYRAAVKASGA